MDWDDSPEQVTFRAKVRAFFEEKLPQRYREPSSSDERHSCIASNGEQIEVTGRGWDHDRFSTDPEHRAVAKEWADALAAEGYVAPGWEREHGGAGFTSLETFIFNEEREAAGAPRVSGTGAMFLGSLLMVHGNAEQQAKWMPPIARGEVNWAQGYSEPGAGSDLASLQLRAVRDGDDYVLNGQKLWGNPMLSESMYCLVRTDPEAPKHKGISFLMIEDINSEGVGMRNIPNMAGDLPGNGETFFSNVRVPRANLVGPENQGWYVAMTLMDFDRASLSNTLEDRRMMKELIEYATSDEGRRRSRVAEHPTVRAELADRMVEIEVGRNLSLRVASMQANGLIPNYEASMGKMFSTELRQRAARTGTKVFGLYANLWSGDERAPLGGEFTTGYCRTVGFTIYGGSSEIQRNVIATRGLGLPRG